MVSILGWVEIGAKIKIITKEKKYCLIDVQIYDYEAGRQIS